jgi:hypothetical protein|uniref:Uncharacterized protein n=1 Tax=viral metagenome TaxID=1070528 RepID=A0A6H1ZB83_9ZZZZ
MTAPALVRSSDLKRMADIAKAKGVTVWIEMNGRRVGISPDTSAPRDYAAIDEIEEIRL